MYPEGVAAQLKHRERVPRVVLYNNSPKDDDSSSSSSSSSRRRRSSSSSSRTIKLMSLRLAILILMIVMLILNDMNRSVVQDDALRQRDRVHPSAADKWGRH